MPGKRMTLAMLATTIGLGATAASADPAAYLGATLRFGGNTGADLGLTAKILSTNREDKFAVAAGISWYPWSHEAFGADASLGYVFDDAAVLGGYDFVTGSPVLSAGWLNTKDKSRSRPAAPPPSSDGGT